MARTNISKQFSIGSGSFTAITAPVDLETASIEVYADMLIRSDSADSTTEWTLTATSSSPAQYNFNTARQEGGRTPYASGSVLAYLKSVSGTNTVILRGVSES